MAVLLGSLFGRLVLETRFSRIPLANRRLQPSTTPGTLPITEKEIRVALGYDKVKTKGPAKYYDPQTGKKWSGKGKRPKWLEGKQLEDYLVGAPQPQAWWPGEE
ncbi:H-NS family nucleoid-associated regulatory protein [Burkholderia contaminans]|uniref:H-NS family nucleoid-associated regulatory protein n=1 Tax=Burkholderia contaminans TaxID=488447 RepID=UPI001C936FC6|nr:H-NS family nucleoid-associated regulatory protein [Burkholderia contaminans]MBY4814829.1 H-NS histone family protein [Burkholderia contaminans]